MITLTTVAPGTIEDSGGAELRLLGTFDPAQPALVALVQGSVGIACYSGRAGEGYEPTPRSTGLLIAAAPPAPVGVYDVRVQQGSDVTTLAGALVVVKANLYSGVFSLRRILPRDWWTGPRNASLVR